MGHYDTGYSNTGGRAYFRKKRISSVFIPYFRGVLWGETGWWNADGGVRISDPQPVLWCKVSSLVWTWNWTWDPHHEPVWSVSFITGWKKIRTCTKDASAVFSVWQWIVLAAESGFICQYYCGKKGAAWGISEISADHGTVCDGADGGWSYRW